MSSIKRFAVALVLILTIGLVLGAATPKSWWFYDGENITPIYNTTLLVENISATNIEGVNMYADFSFSDYFIGGTFIGQAVSIDNGQFVIDGAHMSSNTGLIQSYSNFESNGTICDVNGCIGSGGGGSLDGSGTSNTFALWLNSTYVEDSKLTFQSNSRLNFSPSGGMAEFYIGEVGGDHDAELTFNPEKRFFIGYNDSDKGRISMLNAFKEGFHVIKESGKATRIHLGNYDDYDSSYDVGFPGAYVDMEGGQFRWDTNKLCFLQTYGGMYCTSSSGADVRMDDGYARFCDGGCTGVYYGLDGVISAEKFLYSGTGGSLSNVIDSTNDLQVLNIKGNQEKYISGYTGDYLNQTSLCIRTGYEESKYVVENEINKICLNTTNAKTTGYNTFEIVLDETLMFVFHENGSIRSKSPDGNDWWCGVDNTGTWGCV